MAKRIRLSEPRVLVELDATEAASVLPQVEQQSVRRRREDVERAVPLGWRAAARDQGHAMGELERVRAASDGV